VTWASTRFGYVKKQRLGTAEAQSGRNASQVAANLGTAALCAIGLVVLPNQRWLVAIAAALAEAAADTVSSEIGQAIGGEPRLVTSWKRVAPGTNGAVTLFGSLAGAMAAAAVALVCYGTALFGSRSALVCAMAGISGMVADSFFGATVERRELLGNNGVNFISTAIAAAVALVI